MSGMGLLPDVVRTIALLRDTPYNSTFLRTYRILDRQPVRTDYPALPFERSLRHLNPFDQGIYQV